MLCCAVAGSLAALCLLVEPSGEDVGTTAAWLRTSSGLLVCSHRGAGTLHAGERVVGEEELRKVIQEPLDAQQCGAARVACIDVDVFASADGELFVGHPKAIRKSGALEFGREPEGTAAATLRDAGVPTFASLLRLVAASDLPPLSVTVEPKGALARSLAGVDDVARAVSASSVGRRVAVIVEDDGWVDNLQQALDTSDVPLAAPIRDDRRRLQALCSDDEAGRAEALRQASKYAVLMPSKTQLCAAMLTAAAKATQRVVTWEVDDEATATDLGRWAQSGLSGVITNEIVAVSAACAQP